MFHRLITLAASLLVLSWTATAELAPGRPAPDFTGTTTAGDSLTLSDFKGRRVVLEWTNHQCPYVRKHYESGTMQRLQRQLTEEGAVWISVISSAPGEQGYVSAEEANELSARRGAYASHVVLDPEGRIGRLYDARTTPHMFLIDEDGSLRYMGAIDDRPSANKKSLDGATPYVANAWDALKAGAAIDPVSTKPYGCTVKYAD